MLPHVLVIDDSAVVREALTTLLVRRGGMRVSVASDPIIAAERIRADRPDVIVLDLEMPRMDGLTFLRGLMASSDPIPTIVCSGFAQAGSEMAIRALEAGAVEVIAKAQLGVRSALEASAGDLIEAVLAAARARVQRRSSRTPLGVPAQIARSAPPAAPAASAVTSGRMAERRVSGAAASDRVVVIGASTGGVLALTAILRSLPASTPGIIVVQHMPQEFTTALARHLDVSSSLQVVEARGGDQVVPGRVLVAAGATHLRVRREGAYWVTELLEGPRVNGHRPSVDVLFHAAAAVAGGSAMGILLTGMGSDGAAGLRALRDAGADTVAQDEATSVVFGMPAEAIRLGGAARVLPLEQIGGAIGRFASG